MMFDRDLYLYFDDNIAKYMTYKERLFGMNEERLRLYLHFVFWKHWYLTFDHSNYSGLNEKDFSRNSMIADLYKQYCQLKDAYWLYSNVKHKVNYQKVLREEFATVCIDVLKTEDYNRYSLTDESKARIYIRRLFADYLKRHVSKLCVLKNSLFDEMKIKTLILSFYQALKEDLKDVLQQAEISCKSDCNALLGEECDRAVEVYTDFFLNINNN